MSDDESAIATAVRRPQDVVLADLAQLHQRFGDEAISFEDFESAKSELLAQLAVE